MAVYFLCPDSDHPTGGIKVIYRHVDILNHHGVTSRVLHQKKGFRCTWFENDTAIAYTRFPLGSLLSRARNKIRGTLDPDGIRTIPLAGGSSSEIGPSDILVIPETRGPDLADIGRGIPRVILNQNAFLTFKHFSFDTNNRKNPYADPTVRAVLVNSEHVEQYLHHAFPRLVTHRFYLSIDPKLFFPGAPKKKRICLSRIKNPVDALQVINILKFRGLLAHYEVVPFINIPQDRVAMIMRESLIFLSLGNREGFGLPAAEAMACGCAVVGYHGWGGREFFKSEFSYPVADGDIIGFARHVEEVIKRYDCDPEAVLEKGRRAAEFIRQTYSPEREEQELVSAWERVLS